METTHILITSLVMMMQQLQLPIEKRNLWTFAAMVALLLKGKRAHLYELGNALPGKGTAESRVHKLRRWLSNPHITPRLFLPVALKLVAPLISSRSPLPLIIDRTEWVRLGNHVNLLLCSIAFKGRSLPIYWLGLSTAGCSSLSDQQALLAPVFTALSAHPQLAALRPVVVADREFCSPKLSRWLRQRKASWCLRVKKSYRVSRTDIPSTPISVFLRHCQPDLPYFFEHITLTDSARLHCHLLLFWRPDCQEPLALVTNLTNPSALTTLYGERMFIETLHRDLKSGGYDLERGRLTDPKRLTNLLLPMAFAYLYTVIQGDLEELTVPRSPCQPRRLSLFTKARNRFQEVFDRHPLAVVTKFFQQLFGFLLTLVTQSSGREQTSLLRNFAQTQQVLLA